MEPLTIVIAIGIVVILFWIRNPKRGEADIEEGFVVDSVYNYPFPALILPPDVRCGGGIRGIFDGLIPNKNGKHNLHLDDGTVIPNVDDTPGVDIDFGSSLRVGCGVETWYCRKMEDGSIDHEMERKHNLGTPRKVSLSERIKQMERTIANLKVMLKNTEQEFYSEREKAQAMEKKIRELSGGRVSKSEEEEE